MAEYVRDTFARTVASGWGTADLGGAWTTQTDGAAVTMRTTGARGNVDWTGSTTGLSAYGRLASAQSVLDSHGAVKMRANDVSLATTAILWCRVAGSGSTFAGYGVRIGRSGAAGGMYAELVRGPANAPVVIGTLSPNPGWPDVSTYYWGELEVFGANPTTVRARWFPSDAVPTDDAGWTTVTDSAGPQAAGVFGYRGTRANTAVFSQYVNAIHAADPLRPGFTVTWDPDGLTAHFVSTVLTTGDPTAHAWTFGDGGDEAIADPGHAYAAPGTYSVTYTAWTRWGTRRTVTQTVTAPGVPGPLPPVRPSVYVNGEDICDRVFAASWSRGRDRWPDDTLGATVTLQVRGRLSDVNMGTPVVIALPPDAPDGPVTLFTGEVDQVNESIDPVDARTTTQLTAMDVAAFLSRWHILPASTFTEGGLPTRVGQLAPRGTTVYRQKWSGVPTARWPLLKSLTSSADNLRTRTYLDLLRDGLRASLATAYVAPDNAIVYAPLDPPAGLVVPILDLDSAGPDCPDHVDNARSTAEGMVNRWTVGAGDVVDRVERPSVEAYGESSWSVGQGVLKTAATFPITDPIAAQLREPFQAKSVTVPIRSWSARSYLAQPLDMASMNGQLYGILGTKHDVSLDSGWRVTLTLDRDPWTMTGAAPPTPSPARTATQTFDCEKDSMLASPNSGAGKSTRLPVGLWAGTKFRALIQFDLDYAHKPTRIVSADLLLDTAGQDSVGFGSSPQIQIDRITGSWSEGGAGGSGPPWTYSQDNAVVYPGPSTTSSGRQTASITTNTNADVSIALTLITRAWADGASNRGIRLISTNEGSTSRTTEFYASEYSTSSRRPRLRVTYEY